MTLDRDEAVKICIAMDKVAPLIYTLKNKGPTKIFSGLGWSVVSWNSLFENEKMSLVQSGNFFFSKEDAVAAVERAMTASNEKAVKLLEILSK